MSLIFHTPSRRCPLRRLNGRHATILGVHSCRVVRRIGPRATAVYFIRIMDNGFPVDGMAFGDELYFDPAPRDVNAELVAFNNTSLDELTNLAERHIERLQ